MLEKYKDTFDINFEQTAVSVVHDRESVAGPQFIKYKGITLAENFSSYVDDRKDSAAVVRHSKGYTKAGVNLVEIEGYLPIGSEIHFKHKYSYQPDYVRVTTDIRLHTGTVIKRHFGVGSFTMPGKWTRFHLTPAPRHLQEGAKKASFDIPEVKEGEKPVMIGHWHRPPLSIVFEHEKGFYFEVGTGFDVWRWEKCLDYGPEAASYKIFATADGLEVVREPLMCCHDYEPQANQYRYTWYMSWGERKEVKEDSDIVWIDPLAQNIPDALDKVGIDLYAANWPESFRRVATPEKLQVGETEEKPCFAHSKVQNYLRKVLRKIKDRSPKELWLKNFNCGVCCQPSHVARKGEALYHNDSNYILDFYEWVRHAFRDVCEVKIVKSGEKSLLDFDTRV